MTKKQLEKQLEKAIDDGDIAKAKEVKDLMKSLTKPKRKAKKVVAKKVAKPKKTQKESVLKLSDTLSGSNNSARIPREYSIEDMKVGTNEGIDGKPCIVAPMDLTQKPKVFNGKGIGENDKKIDKKLLKKLRPSPRREPTDSGLVNVSCSGCGAPAKVYNYDLKWSFNDDNKAVPSYQCPRCVRNIFVNRG